MEKHGGREAEGVGQPEDMGQPESDELGAHVSSSGGVQRAPARAEEIESAVLQLFTKQPARWAERRRARIATAVAHDSYLINLSSPDPALLAAVPRVLHRRDPPSGGARDRLRRNSSRKRHRWGHDERHRPKCRGGGARLGRGEGGPGGAVWSSPPGPAPRLGEPWKISPPSLADSARARFLGSGSASTPAMPTQPDTTWSRTTAVFSRRSTMCWVWIGFGSST